MKVCLQSKSCSRLSRTTADTATFHSSPMAENERTVSAAHPVHESALAGPDAARKPTRLRDEAISHAV
jgi:hypothetical protein